VLVNYPCLGELSLVVLVDSGADHTAFLADDRDFIPFLASEQGTLRRALRAEGIVEDVVAWDGSYGHLPLQHEAVLLVVLEHHLGWERLVNAGSDFFIGKDNQKHYPAYLELLGELTLVRAE